MKIAVLYFRCLQLSFLCPIPTQQELSAAPGRCALGLVDWGNLPVVNFFYDIVDDAPSHDEIKEFINIIGLLASLMLGVACSVSGAVSWGDLEEMAEIVRTCYYPNLPARAISMKLANYSILGTAFLFANLIGVVVVYTSLCTVGFGKIPKRQVQKAMEIWWASGGSVMTMVLVALLGAGVVTSCQAYYYLCVITFWDPRATDANCDDGSTLHGFAGNAFALATWGTLILSVCIMSRVSSKMRPFMAARKFAPGTSTEDE